ncbi:uncharacterized protein EMH_0048360 [Eimeria mitis]|uniref:Uncharacterized protein n=1 Tax=Eimeria mitis TaxID=44415 RepID=U6JZ02_9EIME|nr:uncharacterized protein EMH_0048360 [Eimeria mitis]CDJ29282.1 hypothetical protein EMH_0048360 [Eimeria mitis]
MPRQRTVCESRALLGIKELFKKPFLDSKDLEHLMTHLEQLVEYSIYRAKENIGRLSPKYIVAKLGYALLVTDAIYAASEDSRFVGTTEVGDSVYSACIVL